MSSSLPSDSPKQPPRRVPPPCWTHEETLALIESYHEKWYTLRRGNLKASHWQEVADAVARRCRFTTPSKTSVQCRHKIEKLRKRYRSEKQRAIATAPHRYTSSWNFFKKMDDMERGPLSMSSASNTATTFEQVDNQEDDDDDEYDDDDNEEDEHINYNQFISSPANYHHMISNNNGSTHSPRGSGSGAGGFRLRIPSGSRQTPSPLGLAPSAKPKNYTNYPRYDGSHTSTPTHTSTPHNSMPTKPGGYVSGSGVKREREIADPVGEMVMSIRMLGEGFVKMEQKKIEMAKEMEQMRMEMEIKRTEMILESQQKIVEAFAKGIAANKKVKKMPSPEL